MASYMGSLSTYGVVAGACAVLPIPMLDAYLGRLARGAGVRRAALRHGIELTREAREVLASPGIVQAAAGTSAARVVRGALTRWNVPVTVLGSLEDGFSAWLAATLLDRYLASRPKNGGQLVAEEARRVRRAVSLAAAEGLTRMGADTPRGLGRALQTLGRAIERSADDRVAAQRIADALLDGLADLPEQALEYFVTAFDQQMERSRVGAAMAAV